MKRDDSDAQARLDALAAGAPHRSANVRTLARFAANSECNLATLGFAARVDFDRLLANTSYAVPFGQSPFAFRRGNTFEQRLRRDNHGPILRLFQEKLGYDVSSAGVTNLRGRFPPNEAGMQARAEETERLVSKIVRGDRDAPNLIDGAVLTRSVGGIPAYFEADAIAARFQEPIHVGEIKSFPTVDGQADPDKVGAAIAQVSIYILLLRELVERVGGDPQIVSDEALLITPLNTGLQPTMTTKVVAREIERARRILDRAPSAEELVAPLRSDLPSFAEVADERATEEQRVDAANRLADEVGTHYQPACLSSCGMSRLCRERAHAAGSIDTVGGKLLRLLPGIESFDRVTALACGAPPQGEKEKVVSMQLVRASLVRERVVEIGQRRAK